MANRVPEEILWNIRQRSGGRCEVCREWGKSLTPPHHIVKRRHMNHRPEAQIHGCLSCHNELEDDRSESGLDYQLRLVLQEFYFDFYKFPEWRVRKLMGSRLFVGEIQGENGAKAREHFYRVKKRIRTIPESCDNTSCEHNIKFLCLLAYKGDYARLSECEYYF